MIKFYEEKIKKPTDELVKLAEINRELTLQEWKNQPQDMWEDWGNREDNHKEATL